MTPHSERCFLVISSVFPCHFERSREILLQSENKLLSLRDKLITVSMKRIIECVPNFSEGRDRGVIDAIVAAIASVEGVKVLDVDPGEATNRTVVTFVGEPGPVLAGAFKGVAKAQELIDMRQHHGAHPRSGATDVLPLIPVSGITLEECAGLARTLAERLYKELGIPCYCYEAAAFKPERKNLAVCRAGEYEALPEKMADPDRKPDFGGEFDETAAKAGATNVGARNFLIAVNYNLNTTSTRRAMAVAFDVREKGRKAREGGSLTGKLLKDENGEQIWIPGTLKGCKAIGWYIDEYGIAQAPRAVLAFSLASKSDGVPEKIADPARRPDFSPAEYNDIVARSGASNVGARNFLVAVNYNLNTTSTRRAMAVDRKSVV